MNSETIESFVEMNSKTVDFMDFWETVKEK